MDKVPAILDQIFANVFGYKNPYTFEQFMQKFAFDVRLPKEVVDFSTGEKTFAQSTNPSRFMTMKNSLKDQATKEWSIEKRPLNNIQDILAAWNETNFAVSERQKESTEVYECDNIYNSQLIFRSQDIHFSKNVVCSDSCHRSEYLACSQRSNACTYSLRVEDSIECSNSFNIIWSGKIANSLFISDCYNMYECMFCSHLSGKRFWIANMPFEEEEYRKIKKMVVEWILTS